MEPFFLYCTSGSFFFFKSYMHLLPTMYASQPVSAPLQLDRSCRTSWNEGRKPSAEAIILVHDPDGDLHASISYLWKRRCNHKRKKRIATEASGRVIFAIHIVHDGSLSWIEGPSHVIGIDKRLHFMWSSNSPACTHYCVIGWRRERRQFYFFPFPKEDNVLLDPKRKLG